MSVGVACNIYNDARALPGFLESAVKWADDIFFYHAGPQGKYSDDGTIEIIEKWGARIKFGRIDDGFGVVRTNTVHGSNCEWVVLLDTDERFHALAPVLVVDESLNVVISGEPYNQAAWLKTIINQQNIDAVCAIRRHWHDLTWTRPTQSWEYTPDHQLRIVRNAEYIQYKEYPKMHEHIIDTRFGHEPNFLPPNRRHGPFYDHYHNWFKPLEIDQRQHDIAIYDAINEDRTPPTWEEFQSK